MSTLSITRIVSEHGVLQRNSECPIRGWAAAGTNVQVTFRGVTLTTRANEAGKWRCRIPTGQAGGPFELVVRGEGQTITLRDILVGEVWFCSGQSNMEFVLRDSQHAQETLAGANLPGVRLFTHPQRTAGTPCDDAQGDWRVSTAESAAGFSAVGFHFGKMLHERLGVPVGLINSSWGGTTCEAWISRPCVQGAGKFGAIVERAAAPAEPTVPHVDPGIAPPCAGFPEAGLHDDEWETMRLPQAWERTGLNIDGAVWFRKRVQIPAEWRGKDLLLSLGALDDFDITWFNGQEVGRMGLETPNSYATPRRYTIPGRLVEAGPAVIATRVFDQWGDGGFTGQATQMYLSLAADESQRIALAGEWRFRVELALPPRNPAATVAPFVLFNGMVAPVAPFSVRGAIWYQGESNADRAAQYRELFPLMIRNWRQTWGSELAFLFVLLAGWQARREVPGESAWAELRDAQLAALGLPGTAAASAVDLGDEVDIHPRNKRDVGERLALAALGTVYGQKLEYSGPVMQSCQLNGGSARVTFAHADGLQARGNKVAGFAVAGKDQVWRWAEGRIEGMSVVLTCPALAPIAAVRYAWADYPEANLYNAAGLPALPFRSDEWPLITRDVQ